MNSFINSKFASFLSQDNGKQVFIKINSVDTGSFKVQKDTKLVACVGSRKTFPNCRYEFSAGNHTNLNKVWSFTYKNAQRSSLVFVLYKGKTFFGNDQEIGEIEIKLSALACNRVTTHEFVLRSPDKNAIPARVSLSIHVSENGCKAFTAPAGDKIRSDFEIIHKETFTQQNSPQPSFPEFNIF